MKNESEPKEFLCQCRNNGESNIENNSVKKFTLPQMLRRRHI